MVEGDTADADDQQQTVGRGIQNLAELRYLSEMAGDVPIYEVCGAEHR